MGLVATVAVALLACDVSRGTKSHHAEQLRLDVRAQTKKNKGITGNGTAVIFRTHVLDASVLSLLSRTLRDLAWSHHVCFMFDKDKLKPEYALDGTHLHPRYLDDLLAPALDAVLGDSP